jgi:hypothetical protein
MNQKTPSSADSGELRTKRLQQFPGDYSGERGCFRCGKPVKAGRGRWIHVIGGGSTVLHPADEALYVPDGGDLGGQMLGSDCAKRLGLEWSTPESSSNGAK